MEGNETVGEENPAAAEAADASQSTEATEGLIVEESAAEESQEITEEVVETGEEEVKPEETESDDTEDASYEYNGVKVDLDIPDDLRDELSAKELDADALAKELYSGDFEFSDETRAKLDSLYGKLIVDSFLSGIKATNDLNMKNHSDSKATADAANKVAWDAAMEQVGGEDNWSAMEAWADANLSDADFNGFNSAMESGNPYLQKLAISDMSAKYQKSEGDTEVQLVEGETSAPQVEGALSASQYQALFRTGEYKTNPQKYDAMRRKGQSKGL